MKRLSTPARPIKVFLALIGPLLLSASAAYADPTLAGTGSNGSFTGGPQNNPADNTALSASANFSVSGSTLTVVLTNTSTVVYNTDHGAGAILPTDILFAVTWSNGSSNSGITLTPSSASASAFVNGTGTPSGTSIGDFYEYKSPISSTTWPGADQGISSVGYGVFGPKGNFGSNPQNIDGFNTAPGIVGTGYVAGTGVDGIPSKLLVQNAMTFNLTIHLNGASSFDLANITNVFFQYGTSLEAPNTNVVPEPSTIAIAGLGALGFVAYGLRRRLKK